jgi:hypothetical protein
MADGGSKRWTVHGWQRHREGARPTLFAFQDRDNPEEVYEQDDGRMIYVGKRRRVHVFDKDSHLTSFLMSRRARQEKVKQGKWRRVY